MPREWPLRSFLELGAYPEAVPCARLHTRQILWEWGQSEPGEGIELVVSELVTNAVHASRSLKQGTPLRLWLFSDKEKVLILVWDANPQPPTPASPGSSEIAEGGRGLLLVDAISDEWSWYFVTGTSGKVVWALCGHAEADTA